MKTQLRRLLFLLFILGVPHAALAQYRGDIRLGDTIDLKFTTVDTSGVPTTLAGTPVVSCYPGNSTTEITAGITLTVDFDARTGMHNVRVAATSGNGYATATNYECAVTTGTVGGTSVVGYVIGSFSIENRSGLMPTTAARTLDVSAGGEAGVDWANVGSPTTTVNLSGTTISTTQDVDVVASVTGLTASDVGAIKTKTDFLPSATAGAAGGVFIAGTNAPVTITGSGNALTLTSTGGNGHGLVSTGNGTGAGLRAVGGATGDGATLVGGATSGDGLSASATTSGHGIEATGVGSVKAGLYAYNGSSSGWGISAYGLNAGISASSATYGINVSGGSGGAGMNLYGGDSSTAPGLSISSGSSGGSGLAVSGSGTGNAAISAIGAGHANGMNITGSQSFGATPAGSGLKITGGAASTTSGGVAGPGIVVTGGAGAASTNGAAAGATFTAGGTTTVSGNDGIKSTGTAAGEGLKAVGGATGYGLEASGVAGLNVYGNTAALFTAVVNNGTGIYVSGGDATGTGVAILGGASGGDAVNISAQGGNADGIDSTGSGTGAGLKVTGGGTGHGLQAIGGGTSGDAIRATVTSGVEFRALKEGSVVSDAGNTSSTFKTNLTESTTDHWKDNLITFTSGSLAGQVKKVTGYDGTTKFITVSPAFTGTPSASDTFSLVNK